MLKIPPAVYAYKAENPFSFAELKNLLAVLVDNICEKISEGGAEWYLIGLDMAELFNKQRL